MKLSQAVPQDNQSADADGLAFVPSDRPTAEVRRFDADPAARRPALDRVDIPIEELRLLASRSSTGGHLSAKRTSRLRIGLLITGLVAVAAFLGWQHRGDEVKQTVSSLASVLAAPTTNPSRFSIVERETVSESQLNARRTDASEHNIPAQMAPPARMAETVAELQQQLEAVKHSLSVMTQTLEQLAAKQEQLAAKQEQMSRDIASLRAAKQDDKLNTAPVRPLRSIAAPSRKTTAGLPRRRPCPGPYQPSRHPLSRSRTSLFGRPCLCGRNRLIIPSAPLCADELYIQSHSPGIMLGAQVQLFWTEPIDGGARFTRRHRSKPYRYSIT